jgi:Concanavalin A-like lectin/glucanases superfamily
MRPSLQPMRHSQITLALALALAAISCRGAETFSGTDITLGTGGHSVGSGGMGNSDGLGSGGDSGGIGGSGGIAGTGGLPAEDARVDSVPPVMPIEDAAVIDLFDLPIEMKAPPDLAREQTPEAPRDVATDPTDVGNAPEPNLIGYWKFDDGMGATTLRDSSGNNNHATVQGTVTWTTGSANLPPLMFPDPAAVVVGSGSATAMGTMLPANSAHQTISVWVNSKTDGEQYILCLWNQTAQNAVALGYHAGQLAVWKWNVSTLVGTTPPTINTWHHVAYTYDGTTHRLYVDGKTPVTSTIPPNTAAVTRTEIGAFSGGTRFNGQLDDLRIYNIALTATQIARLAAGGFTGTGP